MQRFYYKEKLQEKLIISDIELYNQITRVLRAKVGNEFIFFDGKTDFDFVYKIESIDKKNVILNLINKIDKFRQKKEINLYQASPNKYEKIDYILQKGVEVGISNFYFFKSERSQEPRIDNKKIARFEKIIIEAIEQSGQNHIPKLSFKTEIKDLNGTNIFFHTNSENSKKMKEINFEKLEKINIFVGPEGGFSNNEVKYFEEKGFLRVNLGENIMRTETVGIVTTFYIKQ